MTPSKVQDSRAIVTSPQVPQLEPNNLAVKSPAKIRDSSTMTRSGRQVKPNKLFCGGDWYMLMC